MILGLHALAVLWNTISWRCVLPSEARGIRLRTLASLLVAGDAVNTVVPTALVGGEVVRVGLLSRRISTPSAAVSVGLAAMSQFFGQALFILMGLPIVMTAVRNRSLRLGLTLISVGLLALLLGLVLLVWSRAGMHYVERRLDRLRWFHAWWTTRGQRWRSVLAEALDSLRMRPASFVRSVAASFLAWLTGIVQTRLILRLLGVSVGWRQALCIEVLSVAIEGALFFVPAKVGTQEGGRVLIFLTMGLDPSKGFALGFVRRLCELASAAVGLGVLGYHQSSRGGKAPTPTPAIAASAADPAVGC